MLAALQGDTEQATTLTAEVRRIATPIGATFLLAVSQLVLGVAELGDARHAEAYEHVSRLFDPADPVSQHSIRSWAIGER